MKNPRNLKRRNLIRNLRIISKISQNSSVMIITRRSISLINREISIINSVVTKIIKIKEDFSREVIFTAYSRFK